MIDELSCRHLQEQMTDPLQMPERMKEKNQRLNQIFVSSELALIHLGQLLTT